jgi:hypothetical protein
MPDHEFTKALAALKALENADIERYRRLPSQQPSSEAEEYAAALDQARRKPAFTIDASLFR